MPFDKNDTLFQYGGTYIEYKGEIKYCPTDYIGCSLYISKIECSGTIISLKLPIDEENIEEFLLRYNLPEFVLKNVNFIKYSKMWSSTDDEPVTPLEDDKVKVSRMSVMSKRFEDEFILFRFIKWEIIAFPTDLGWLYRGIDKDLAENVGRIVTQEVISEKMEYYRNEINFE